MSLCVGGGACGELRPAPPLALASYPPNAAPFLRRAHARVVERCSTTRAWAVRGCATHGTQVLVRNPDTDCWAMVSLLESHLTNACRDFFDFSMSLSGILTGIVCFSKMCPPPPQPPPHGTSLQLHVPVEVVRRPRNHIVVTLVECDMCVRARGRTGRAAARPVPLASL